MQKVRIRTLRNKRKICKGVGGQRRLDFIVKYGSKRVCGQKLTREETEFMPTISFNPIPSKMYTLAIYDINSPQPAFLHALIPNITDPVMLHPAVPYVHPAPPPHDNHYHAYIIELLEQPGLLTMSPRTCARFDIGAFTKTYGLRRLAATGFYIDPRAA